MEAKAHEINDYKMIVDFVKLLIFARFRTSTMIISNDGLYFCNKIF